MDFEDRLAILEKKNSVLEHEVKRLRAVNEIQNLMSRYEYYYSANDGEKVISLFAQHTPGTHVEKMNGIFDGIEGVRRAFGRRNPGNHTPGATAHHVLTTPVIEVANDGKTGKAVWISPGEETSIDRETGKPVAHWAWMKYGCDFVTEDNQWKIWHFHIFGIFFTPFGTSWTELTSDPFGGHSDEEPREDGPDRPPTTHYNYSPTTIYPFEPIPPLPYETFDEKYSY